MVPLEYLVGFKTIRTDSLSSEHSLHSHRKINQQFHQDYVEEGLFEEVEFLSEISFPHNAIPTEPSSLQNSLFGLHRAREPASSPSIEISLVKFASPDQAHDILQDLAQKKKIWYAEPNRVTQSHASNFHSIAQKYSENAQKFAQIKITNTDKALDYIARLPDTRLSQILASPPVIAIFDSGVDVEHPALKNKVVDLTHLGSQVCQNGRYGCNTAKDEGRSFKKGVLGNTHSYPIQAQGYGSPCDKGASKICNHGTQVAGLAVGFHEGVYGTCPFCLFLPVRVTQSTGKIQDDAIIRGLQYLSLFQKTEIL